MGHYISGIVAPLDVLLEYASSTGLHRPAWLVDKLGFLPLSDHHLDGLFPEQGEFEKSMTYLSTALKHALGAISSRGPVAFIETEYFGGHGSQGAVVFERGRCVLEPRRHDSGVISEALIFLGVTVRAGDHDEFESAGFGRYRNNEDWIESVEDLSS